MNARTSLTLAAGLLALTPVARGAAGGSALALVHSGFLLDADDAPLDGTVSLGFAVFAAPTAGIAEWSGTCASVPVIGGYFTIDVAACAGTGGTGDQVLDTSDLPAGSARWLELTVGSTVLQPRLVLGAVPVASVASRALTADRIGAETLVDVHDAARLTGVAPATVLGTGSAGISTVGTVTAGAWQATPVTDSYVASAAAWHAKLGSVAHDSTLTGAGTSASPLGLGTDGSSLQGVDAAKLGGMTLAQLQASIEGGTGGQANAGVASPSTCGPSTVGLLFFDTSVPATPTLKVCNGAFYVALGTVPPPPGAPTAPTVTPGDATISVSWTAVANATGYEVGYAAGATLGASPIVVSVGSMSATLTGLTNDQAYTVAVRTVANQWKSAWSPTAQTTPSQIRTIVTFGTGRRWSDGTYALNCKGYKFPVFPYTYAGATGDGIYTIDPDGAQAGVAFDAHCDMSNDSGGWTLVFRLAENNWNHNNADNVPPTPAKTKAKFASSVINQISGQALGNAYEMRLAGPVTTTLMKASEPFYVEMNTAPVTVQYDCDKNGVYEKSKTWNSWYIDRGAGEGSTWIRDWTYPANGQCNAWNGGNVLQFWPGTSTTPGTTGTGAPIHATASSYQHNGNLSLYVR